MKKYNLYFDDTGFNAHEKQSERLKSEQGTYVGVIIPTESVEALTIVINGMSKLLKDKYGVDEFHFTDIYNSKKPFDIMSKEEKIYLLASFADIFRIFDLKIAVYTSVNNKKGAGEQSLDNMVEFLLSNMQIKSTPKSKALIYSYLRAKKYLSENEKDFKIENLISDEGLRKSGTTAEIKGSEFKIRFASSKDEKMLQIADYAAWFITRAKNIYDKMSTKKEISDMDTEVIKIYSKLSNNYVGLTKKWIDLSNLKNFDYDKIISESIEKE